MFLNVTRISFYIIVINSTYYMLAESQGPGAATGDLPPGLLPAHKTSIMLFLERVYGIPDQSTFFRILEDAILPDLRAATTLDTVNIFIKKTDYCSQLFSNKFL